MEAIKIEKRKCEIPTRETSNKKLSSRIKYIFHAMQ